MDRVNIDKLSDIAAAPPPLRRPQKYRLRCRLIAEPTCITGSIGVTAPTFIVQNLMDKVGIEPVTLLASDSPQKDLGNPFRAWTDRDREKYVSLLDGAYAIFNQWVKDGRGLAIPDPARIDELANGSIYMAQEALANGLIDAIGYLATPSPRPSAWRAWARAARRW